MKNTIQGRCACGAIEYSTEAEVEFAFNCHCRKCQRATGAGHSSAFAVSKESFHLSGVIKEFRSQSDNGAATYSGFCPDCGSPLTSRTDRFPERIYVLAATMDDPSEFQPQFVVFEEMALPWDTPSKRLAKARR